MATTKLFNRTKKDVFDIVLEEDEMVPVLERGETDQTETDLDNEKTADPPDAAPNDVEAETDSTPEQADRSGQPGRRGRWLRRTVVGVAVVLFAAAVGLAGVLGWHLKQQKDIDDAGKAALAKAQSYAVTLTSIDPAHVDANFDQVLNGATGEFKDMYSQSASQLRQVLIDNKATSKGIVVDSAIKSATKSKVEVLLFIDQSITNTVNPQPRIDRSRVAMTMEFVDGRWLASKVDIK